MTIAQVKTMLEAITGFANKVVYWAWPEDEAPALPFICYYTPSANNFGADNTVYYSANRFVIELYTLTKETATETSVENKLKESGVYFTKTINFLDDEKCYMTQYEIEV